MYICSEEIFVCKLRKNGFTYDDETAMLLPLSVVEYRLFLE